MALDKNDLSKTVSRSNTLRSGGGRSGFAPDDVKDALVVGDQTGPLFGWTDASPRPTNEGESWTTVKE